MRIITHNNMKHILILLIILLISALCPACGKKPAPTFTLVAGESYVYCPAPGDENVSVPIERIYQNADGTPVNDKNIRYVWEFSSASDTGYFNEYGHFSGGAVNPAIMMLSVTSDFNYGDINGQAIIIKCTARDKEDNIVAQASTVLKVRAPEEIASFDIGYGQLSFAIANKTSEHLSFDEVLNQYGELYGRRELPTPVYEFSNPGVTIDENGDIHADVKVKDYIKVGMRITLENITKEYRFIVYTDKSGYQLPDEALETLYDGPSPFDTAESVAVYDIPRTYETNEYVHIFSFDLLASEYPDGLKFHVDKMAGYHEGAVYQITRFYGDGTIKTEDLVEANGIITITHDTEKIIEVSPVFRFIFGRQKKEFDSSYINVIASETYDENSLYGFCGNVDNGIGYVHFKGPEPCFVLAVPKAFYNITLTKAGDGRSSILVNGEALGCNVGIGGGAGRTGTTPYTYYMEDACGDQNTLRIGMGEKDTDIAAIEIRRATSLVPRKTHVYIGGDSTASAYYPIETKEPQPGRAKTGFGQMFCQFVTDQTAITNLGSGGTYAKSWYDIAFDGVIQNAQKGDIFVIMEGINDQSYSNVDEMVDYLSRMVDECRRKGIIPVLCTPMQSPKFWRTGDGRDLGEFESPQGGGKAGFMLGIRQLAKDKGVFLIDVAYITSRMYGTLGRTFVAQNFHLYNKATGSEEDTLHLSYEGAKNIAGIIATELYKLQESGETDRYDNVIKGITFNPLGTASYTYTNAKGETATYEFERIEAVYRRYGER